MTITETKSLLRQEGCLRFLDVQAEQALKEIGRICPEGMAVLSRGAEDAMTEQFRDRMFILYIHPLMQQVRNALMEIDPIEGIFMSGNNMRSLRQALEKTADLLGTETDRALIMMYPLIEEYAERIRKNFVQSQSVLLKRLLMKKEEISKTLFGGRPFDRILELSGDAGDIHRHGQCVQRIVTDAGACYYKPHDL